MTFDSVCWNASCTKLFTAVSALQCVERGQLSLDSPINDILSEFNEKPLNQIITGFDDDSKPQYKPASKPITLRHLLTHSSGLGYNGMDPMLVQWWTSMGFGPDVTNTTVKHSGMIPRLYEAGDGWSYGCGLEWAGQMVRVKQYPNRSKLTTLGRASERQHQTRRIHAKAHLHTSRHEEHHLPAPPPSTHHVPHDQSPSSKPRNGQARSRHKRHIPNREPYHHPPPSRTHTSQVTAEDDYGGNGLYSSAADCK